MKKTFTKIFAFLMIFCLSFIFVGCDFLPGANSPNRQQQENQPYTPGSGGQTPSSGGEEDNNEEEGNEDRDNVGDDEDGDEENENNTSFLNLYGTKVLYRPDNYDYNKGSGGTDEQPNEYYGVYAYYVLKYLYEIYGIVDTNRLNNYNVSNYGENNPTRIIQENNIPYLYDSIRYKVDTLGNVENTIEYTLEGSEPTKVAGTPDDGNYVIVAADTNTKWNWSFEADLDSTIPSPQKPNALLYLSRQYDGGISINFDSPNSTLINNHVANFYDDYSIIIDEYYTGTIQQKYSQIMLGNSIASEPQKDTEHYSEFVKALEYVIYSYALDLDPAEIVIFHHTPTAEDPSYYHVQVNDDKLNIDESLAERKELFNKLGSFVGLAQRQVTKITNWAIENIIGENALSDDTFKTYNVTEIINHFIKPTAYDSNEKYYSYTPSTDTYTLVESGVSSSNYFNYFIYSAANPTYEYVFDLASTTTLGRAYETTLRNIIKGVCEEATIGSYTEGEESSGVPIDDRFLASCISEYSRDWFKIIDDNDFADPTKTYSPTSPYIFPLEYQSVTLMFKEDMVIADLWVALKYDSTLTGTKDGYTNDFIELKLQLNYFNHETGELKTVESDVLKVYDGPYQIGYINMNVGGSSGDDESDPNGPPSGHVSGYAFSSIGELFGTGESYIIVKSFNPNIGGGALMTDVGRSGYKLSPAFSAEPLTITGLTDLRNYYNILENDIDEPGLRDDTSYITGHLNPDKFKGEDGCDYLEITYKVIKENGNTNKNYKFYTGLQFMNCATLASLLED